MSFAFADVRYVLYTQVNILDAAPLHSHTAVFAVGPPLPRWLLGPLAQGSKAKKLSGHPV